MKVTYIVSALSLIASAVHAQESYSGYKVFRVPAENDEAASELQNLLSTLNLDTWKSPKKAGAFADIVVPPEKLTDFENLLGGKDRTVMHEDLGLSIADEAKFDTYQGEFARAVSESITTDMKQANRYVICLNQLVALTFPGSTLTTHTRTTWNGSAVCSQTTAPTRKLFPLAYLQTVETLLEYTFTVMAARESRLSSSTERYTLANG